VSKLSIIIPTHKRPDLLRECLECIDNQTIRNDLEAIVVSDGPDEEAKKVCNDNWKVPLKFFEIEKSQQGVARNKGVKEAGSNLILFSQDDIFLLSDACERHINAHKGQAESNGPLSIAVLGNTTWDPNIKINSAMIWLDKTGWQFGYSAIASFAGDFIPQNIQERFTYTSHISLQRDVASKIPFRSDVDLYGWEDVEWGKRLRENKIRLFYEPNAKPYHHHPLTLEDSLKRMETLGKSIHHFPDIGRKPKGLKRIAYEIAAKLPTMAGRHRKAFLKGLNGKQD